MTTSGVAIGMKISKLVAARPWNRCRPRAKATAVPRIVAISDARRPMRRLSPRELQIPGVPQGLSQASVEKRTHS